MKNSIVSMLKTIIFSAVLLSAVLVVYLLGNEYMQILQQRTQSEAVDGCGEISSYTYTNEKSGVTTKEPIEQNFSKCLELKGIK